MATQYGGTPEEREKELADAARLLKKDHDKILQLVDADIEAARLFYEENIQPKALERLQRFYADKDYYAKKFPGSARRGMNFVMTDVADTIYWILPSLMRVFFGSQDPISMEGRTPEDDPEAMKQLCNWQLQKKNKGFRRFYNWFLDCLQLSYGVIKVLWEKETEEAEDETIMTPEQFVEFDPEAEGVELISAEEQDDGTFLVKVKIERIIKNQPTLYNVPISEFWWLPGFGSDVKDLPFTVHRRKMTRSEIETLVKEGTYEKIDDSDLDAARVQEDDIYDLDEQLDTYRNTRTSLHDGAGSHNLDKSRQVYWVHECFAKYDLDDDNISECWIVTKIGSKIVRLEKNPLKRPPFCVVAPYPDQYEISGITIDDMVGELQDVKTAIMRQVLLNIANNNDRQVLIDPTGLNMDDVKNNRKYVRRTLGQGQRMSDIFQYFPESPLSGAAMDMITMLDSTKADRTGITKYNQGMDSKSLNKMIDVNTIVPMADGSRKLLRDIEDGDKIIGMNGQLTTVVRAHEIQLPKKAYRMEFYSGEVITAGGEHLWQVETQNGVKHVLDTDSIAEYKANHKSALYIPRCQTPQSGLEKELPVEPFFLGLYLGDGHRHSCRITTPDRGIVDYLLGWCSQNSASLVVSSHQNSGLATTYSIVSDIPMTRNEKGQFESQPTLWGVLSSLGITASSNDGCPEKHIPEAYFTASYHQRLELLRGLMDTDGCVHSGGLVIFTQKEGRLLYDTYRLIESLGMWPSLHETNPGSLAKEGCRYFNIHFSAIVNPFGKSEKANKWRLPTRTVRKQSIRLIREVSPIPMRCLTVDASDGLFCVGERFTVTHNTATGVSMIMEAANQRIEMIARMIAETGVLDLFEMMVELNLRYVDNQQVVRLTNGQSLQIDPDDLQGHYDLDVAAGVGAGQRVEAVQNMMMLLSQIYPTINGLMQAQGLPGVGPEKVAAAAATLVQQMGYKDASKYVPTVEEITEQLQQMMQQQQLQAEQDQILEEIKAKAMQGAPLNDEEMAILEQAAIAEQQQAEQQPQQQGAIR